MTMTITLSSTELSMSCTAIMLSWKREENVQRICSAWRDSAHISAGIVFSNANNLPELRDMAEVRSSVDFGLKTRFIAGLLAETDTILIQDDDILLPDSSIERLLQHHEKDKDVVHGIFGRNPKPDGTYAKIVDNQEKDVDVVLTRALVCSKSKCADFFQLEHEFPCLLTGVPKGNGEDIVFSFVSMLKSNRQNKVHKLSYTELADDFAISKRPGHWDRRTEVLRFCSDWLHKKRKLTHGY